MSLENLHKRSTCPISGWLDVFGDKWTLLILRDLLFHKVRNYKDFVCAEEGISTNILADRLKKLVEYGIATKTVDKDNKLLMNYELTKKGEQAWPVFEQMAKWSLNNIPGVVPPNHTTIT